MTGLERQARDAAAPPEVQAPVRADPVLRASDADRDAAAEVLRAAAADGRLDLDELEGRLELVYASRTKQDLTPIVVDLGGMEPVADEETDAPLQVETRSGSVKRVGHWVVPRHIVARCTSGTVKLDFTRASCAHREVTVDAEAKSGTVLLVVPRGWTVRLDTVSAGSGCVKNKATDAPQPGSPTLRVNGSVRSGTVKVRYPYRNG